MHREVHEAAEPARRALGGRCGAASSARSRGRDTHRIWSLGRSSIVSNITHAPGLARARDVGVVARCRAWTHPRPRPSRCRRRRCGPPPAMSACSSSSSSGVNLLNIGAMTFGNKIAKPTAKTEKTTHPTIHQASVPRITHHRREREQPVQHDPDAAAPLRDRRRRSGASSWRTPTACRKPSTPTSRSRR